MPRRERIAWFPILTCLAACSPKEPAEGPATPMAPEPPPASAESSEPSEAPEPSASAAPEEAPASASKGQTSNALPRGWVRFEEEWFEAVIPPGSERMHGTKETTWSVREGAVAYSIRKLPPAKEKFTPQSQVRLATQWLAPCDLQVKLHEPVETAERMSIHYDSACKSGTERHGIMHVTKNAVFIVGVEAPPGDRGELDAFVNGFEPK